MMKQQKRIEYIDTLRGVAISIVVATHLQEIIPVSAIATTGDDYELVGPMTIFFRNINIIFTFVGLPIPTCRWGPWMDPDDDQEIQEHCGAVLLCFPSRAGALHFGN